MARTRKDRKVIGAFFKDIKGRWMRVTERGARFTKKPKGIYLDKGGRPRKDGKLVTKQAAQRAGVKLPPRRRKPSKEDRALRRFHFRLDDALGIDWTRTEIDLGNLYSAWRRAISFHVPLRTAPKYPDILSALEWLRDDDELDRLFRMPYEKMMLCTETWDPKLKTYIGEDKGYTLASVRLTRANQDEGCWRVVINQAVAEVNRLIERLYADSRVRAFNLYLD